MVAIPCLPCLDSSDSESDMSRWGFSHRDSMQTTHGVLAIGIQCRPPDQTKKVLNLGNQQRSDLERTQ